MKFLIVIPVHNEQDFISYCLESLAKQTFADYKIVVVNDGSTDATKKVVNETFEKYSLEGVCLNLPPSSHSPGAKVVQAFNVGLKWAEEKAIVFDILCKFDADIVFPSNYLEQVREIYDRDRAVGMVSGVVYIQGKASSEMDYLDFSTNTSDWVFENLSSRKHVRGPIKSYRKSCFYSMQGLRPVLGWDNIDVMLAQFHGWQVRTIPSLWVKHLRPTANRYNKKKARKLGEYYYNIGLSFPLAFIAALKASYLDKSPFLLLITLFSFLRKSSSPRILNAQEIKFVRKLRWNQFFTTLKKSL